MRESTHKTMARIFRIEPEQMKGKSQRMVATLTIVNIFLDLTGRKMSMDPSRMLTMGALPKKENLDGLAMVEPASRMANLIQVEADKQKPARHKVNVDRHKISAVVKTLALNFGGDVAGIVKLKSHHHYTHRGDIFGMGGSYGKPIRLSYKYAVVIACALDKEMVGKAPGKETQIAAILGYAGSSAASAQLALYIKSLGYEALTTSSNISRRSRRLPPRRDWARSGGAIWRSIPSTATASRLPPC